MANSEKKDQSILTVIVLGAACFLLITGVGVFIASRFYFYLRSPARTIEDHLKAINSGNYEVAYRHFSQDLKGDVSYQDFRDKLEEFSPLLPSRESTFSNVDIQNDKASIEGTLTGRDGAIFPVSYELIKEKGEWKISTYEWTSPGERIRI